MKHAKLCLTCKSKRIQLKQFVLSLKTMPKTIGVNPREHCLKQLVLTLDIPAKAVGVIHREHCLFVLNLGNTAYSVCVNHTVEHTT